jgi:hypothetical protein
MFAWNWFLIAVLALGPLLIGIMFYSTFARSREKQWRDRVLALVGAARHHAGLESGRLKSIARDRSDEAQKLHMHAFDAELRSVPVEDLDPYPGIGPDTIARLRDGGFSNLAALKNARIHIHGLGPKRLRDIDHAVRDLLNRARERFEAGEDAEATRLAPRLNGLADKYEKLELGIRARLRAAETIVDALRPFAIVARRVTFWRYFRPPPQGLIPIEYFHTAFPDLEQTLLRAEQEAEATLVQTIAAAKALSIQPALAVTALSPARVQSGSAWERSLSVSVSPPAPAPKPRPEPPPPADQRSVLEIDPALPLTPDLIRRQFRLLTERYAPEKFATVGAEFVAIAQGKRSAVRAAAAALLAPLGEPLEPPAAPAAPTELRHNPDLDAMFGA